MSACGDLHDDLADVALGQPAGAVLDVHLRSCDACAAELQRLSALALRMDHAVRAAVDHEPVSQVPSGVPASLHSARRARAVTVVRRATAAAIAIAASVTIAFVGLRATQSPSTSGREAARLAAWRSPTGALLDTRGSVIDAPLHDRWFDPHSSPAHSSRTLRGTYGA